MRDQTIRYSWREPSAANGFASGVSLHGHTLHSRESLDFVPRVAAGVPLLNRAVAAELRRQGEPVDFSRAWWTPPLAARQAWDLERLQIEDRLNLRALVSLTDHDNIDAHESLPGTSPVSVEWTVRLEESFLHLGIHNLPRGRAAEWMREMLEGSAANIEGILDTLSRRPEILIVLNHPLWDERGIGAAVHGRMVERFLGRSRAWIHALEFNGIRPWSENLRVVEMARAIGLPVVSGGDRHGLEPNATLNLSGATSFGGFVEEVRGGHSTMLLMPQYNEPRKLRLMETIHEVLSDQPDHALGWVRWNDRVFFLNPEGATRSLAAFWGERQPPLVQQFVGAVRLLGRKQFRPALRFALAERT